MIRNPHLLLADWYGVNNPGVTVHWWSEWAKDFPVVDSHTRRGHPNRSSARRADRHGDSGPDSLQRCPPIGSGLMGRFCRNSVLGQCCLWCRLDPHIFLDYL